MGQDDGGAQLEETLITAADKHEKTVNMLYSGLRQELEGRGRGKSYEARKESGRDDSEVESTSYTIAQAEVATAE